MWAEPDPQQLRPAADVDLDVQPTYLRLQSPQ
jgi:hypothetical protein